jgi:hypothetical protein
MCIHNNRSLLREIAFWAERSRPNVSGVRAYTRANRLVGGWLCYADDATSIAETAEQLRQWHPTVARIDLSLVNTWRMEHDLPPVDENGLPRVAIPSAAAVDEDTPDAVRREVWHWLERARASSQVTA